MIEDIRKNIEVEINMLREIAEYSRNLEFARVDERQLLENAIASLRNSMRIVNDSIPVLLNEISIVRKLPSKTIEEKGKLEKITYQKGKFELKALVHTKDKAKLMKELSIKEGYIKKLKKRKREFSEVREEFKAARGYLKIANRFFLEPAGRLIRKGYFKSLSKDLRKANIDVLFQAYIAMMLMTAFVAFIISIFVMVFFIFFNVGFGEPYLTLFKGNFLLRIAEVIWIPIIAPIATALAIYYYPSTEKSTIAKKINRELPFAVIHMSAIAGSGIQPSEIFRIIGLSKEYPNLKKEIRKILNQINLYGYDLVTALNNTSSNTPSEKLAELLSGLATTINSGGSFTEFFNKRAETLLLDYRLEREQYSKTAETFMDIYISVVIAAPMVLMLLLIMLVIGSINIGFSMVQLTVIIITVITLINIFFLIFIHLKQPTY